MGGGGSSAVFKLNSINHILHRAPLTWYSSLNIIVPYVSLNTHTIKGICNMYDMVSTHVCLWRRPQNSEDFADLKLNYSRRVSRNNFNH